MLGEDWDGMLPGHYVFIDSYCHKLRAIILSEPHTHTPKIDAQQLSFCLIISSKHFQWVTSDDHVHTLQNPT